MHNLYNIICEAIEQRRRLEFIYNSKLRVVEPQFYGIGVKGHEQLRGYQINISPKQEKLFDVGKIERVRMLEERFDGPGPNYNENDSAFVSVICRL